MGIENDISFDMLLVSCKMGKTKSVTLFSEAQYNMKNVQTSECETVKAANGNSWHAKASRNGDDIKDHAVAHKPYSKASKYIVQW